MSGTTVVFVGEGENAEWRVSGTAVLFVWKGMRRTRTEWWFNSTSIVFVREREDPAWKVSRAVQCGVHVQLHVQNKSFGPNNNVDIQY